MWEQIRSNKIKSIFLVVFLAAILLAVGFFGGEYIVPGGGKTGVAIAAGLWVILALVGYYQGGSIMLSMSGARKIEKRDHPRLFNIVEEMVIAGGMPKMPDIYIIDDDAPNAFATGRDPYHSAVAVTSGLLSKLNRDELQGVIAHELSHIKNRDILLMIMVGVMLGVIVILAEIASRSWRLGAMRGRRSSRKGGGQAEALIFIVALLLIILAPIVARLISLAISRKREYLADASGAMLTRYPEGLASALERISESHTPLATANRANAPMYIVNPLELAAAAMSSLFSTHPPTQERIKILRGMAGGASYADYESAYRRVKGGSSIIPGGTLQRTAAVPLRETGAVPSDDRIGRTRETNDLLWKMNDYKFIACPCGTKLKIPPQFPWKSIACLSCGRDHEIVKS